jgi:hypothetical protein
MPYDFNPKVWWLVLGMNDLTRMQCSEEIVVLGILRVVEEIRLRKPDAKIVINSMLPMVNYQTGVMPNMADAVDFTDKDTKNRDKSREVPASFRVGGKGNDDDEKRHLVRALRDDKRQQPPPQRGGRPDRPPPRPPHMSKRERERMEDNATKGPDLDKAMERKKKEMRKEDKKVSKMVMKDDEKYHPKKPVSPLLPMIKKHQLPPVWPAVHLINDKLKEFASKHESITFFDATDIFCSNEGGGRHHLYTELISPRGHPTPKGFAHWEGELMSRLRKILDEIPSPPPKPAQVLGDDEVDYAEDEYNEDYDDEEETEEKGSEHVSEGKTAELPQHEEAPELPGRIKQSPHTDDDEEEEGEDDDEE